MTHPVRVEIYTSPVCPYCTRAKHLLNNKGVAFTEIDVSQNPEDREKMTARAQGRTSVPQIFINDRHIGGCDDLYALEAQGKLTSLLE